MQTLVVANPKGGSGKTTLATNAAGWLAGRKQRVVLADFDPLRAATEWLARRPPLFPAIGGWSPDGAKKELKGEAPQWLVIDTPAELHGESLRDAMRRADILLVPVSPSAFDMGATRHFLDQISEYKAVKKARSRSDWSRCGSTRALSARASSKRSSMDSTIRWLRTCGRRRSTSIAPATGSRCSICRAHAPNRIGSSGER